MPKSALEEADKTERLFLRLPKTSIEEIYRCANRSGVSPGQFLAMAMMIGTRALDRVLYPEGQMTPTLIEQMSASMMQQIQGATPEQFQAMVKAYGLDKM